MDSIVLDPSSPDGLGGADSSEPETEQKVLKVLNDRSKPLSGTGTKEDPYVFVCANGAVIQTKLSPAAMLFLGYCTSVQPQLF